MRIFKKSAEAAKREFPDARILLDDFERFEPF